VGARDAGLTPQAGCDPRGQVADIALEWTAGSMDMSIAGDDLASEEGLRTAVLLSLFTDRRAESDDVLPADDGDRRGWWGDELAAVEGDLLGSRLWLLDRSTRRVDVARRAEEFVREALAWMLEDRVAKRIDVEVTTGDNDLTLAVTIHRPQAQTTTTFRFDHVWREIERPQSAASLLGQTGDAMLRSSAVQSVNSTDLVVSGLNGDVDGEYLVEGRILVPTATAQVVNTLPNGLTTNLFSRLSSNVGTPALASSAWQIASLTSGFTGTPLEVAFEMRLFARKTLNGAAVNRSQFGRAACVGTATNVETYPFSFVGCWIETTTNLTSLVIRSSVASGILAKSEVRVWAPSSSFGP
jgi:phage gp46-like protein